MIGSALTVNGRKVGEVWMIEQILKILLFWLVVFGLVWIYVLIEDIKDRF